jgi:hypothetical protein
MIPEQKNVYRTFNLEDILTSVFEVNLIANELGLYILGRGGETLIIYIYPKQPQHISSSIVGCALCQLLQVTLLLVHMHQGEFHYK